MRSTEDVRKDNITPTEGIIAEMLLDIRDQLIRFNDRQDFKPASQAFNVNQQYSPTPDATKTKTGSVDADKKALEILEKVKEQTIGAFELKPEEINRMSIRTEPDHYELKAPYFGDKEMFAEFAQMMTTNFNAEYISDRGHKKYFFKIPRSASV
jgi:hypothetical protein